MPEATRLTAVNGVVLHFNLAGPMTIDNTVGLDNDFADLAVSPLRNNPPRFGEES